MAWSENPKSGKSHDRYAKYMKATTFAEIRDLHKNKTMIGAFPGKTGDMINDIQKGHLRIERTAKKAALSAYTDDSNTRKINVREIDTGLDPTGLGISKGELPIETVQKYYDMFQSNLGEEIESQITILGVVDKVKAFSPWPINAACPPVLRRLAK